MFRNTTITATTAWGSLLVTWSGLTVCLGLFVDTGETRLLLPLLSALVNAIGLWRPLPSSGMVAGLIAGLLFVAVRVMVDGPLGILATGAISPLGLIGAGFLADALSRQSEAEAERRRQDARLIEELTPTLGELGVLKWSHALRQGEEELVRARRYKHPLCLALVELVGWDELKERSGASGAQQVLDQLAQFAAAEVRTMDRVGLYKDGVLGIFLPHTALDGALLFFEKFRSQGESVLHHGIRAGVAEFPTDAAALEDLVREAEAALEFTRESGLNVASRSLFAAGASA